MHNALLRQSHTQDPCSTLFACVETARILQPVCSSVQRDETPTKIRERDTE